LFVSLFFPPHPWQSPDKIPAVAKVLTASAAPPPSPRNAAVNEHFLFHGLNHAHLDTITREGFNPRFCSLEGMFGSALYFAEHSSKANQYTHCGEISHLFLSFLFSSPLLPRQVRDGGGHAGGERGAAVQVCSGGRGLSAAVPRGPGGGANRA
jgi:hypothetical protein